MDYQMFILVGNVTKDAKIQKSKKGNISFATFSVGAKNSKERTSFFPVVIFGNLGESLAPHVTKGRKVLIEGHIEVSDVGRFNVIAERVVLGHLPKTTTEPVKEPEKTK